MEREKEKGVFFIESSAFFICSTENMVIKIYFGMTFIWKCTINCKSFHFFSSKVHFFSWKVHILSLFSLVPTFFQSRLDWDFLTIVLYEDWNQFKSSLMQTNQVSRCNFSIFGDFCFILFAFSSKNLLHVLSKFLPQSWVSNSFQCIYTQWKLQDSPTCHFS